MTNVFQIETLITYIFALSIYLSETSGHLSTFIGFNKIRVLLRSLTIILDDLTFSNAKQHAWFGVGKICMTANITLCIGANAMIDLRGTPFKIKVNFPFFDHFF